MLLIFCIEKNRAIRTFKTIGTIHLFFVFDVAFASYLVTNQAKYFGQLMLVIWNICGFDYDFHVGAIVAYLDRGVKLFGGKKILCLVSV